MTKKKQSIKLPIFLMVAPIAGIILSIFLYAIVNFIFTGVSSEPAASSDMSLSDGAGIAQGVDANDDLYGETPIFKTVANVVLFLLGSVSMLAIVPCLVVGIIMLNRRRNPQTDDAPATKNKESRDWGDLE
jgi:hypothetical protein